MKLIWMATLLLAQFASPDHTAEPAGQVEPLLSAAAMLDNYRIRQERQAADLDRNLAAVEQLRRDLSGISAGAQSARLEAAQLDAEAARIRREIDRARADGGAADADLGRALEKDYQVVVSASTLARKALAESGARNRQQAGRVIELDRMAAESFYLAWAARERALAAAVCADIYRARVEGIRAQAANRSVTTPLETSLREQARREMEQLPPAQELRQILDDYSASKHSARAIRDEARKRLNKR